MTRTELLDLIFEASSRGRRFGVARGSFARIAIVVLLSLLITTGVAATRVARGDEESPASEKKTKAERPANRLAKEASPYLLLHAHNPVDWYPWGEEAFARAKAEDKLIFLSIGYSSCYWCHVMERESFMDDEVAAFMNEHFVCVKVDREERPDVDEIYMTALAVLGRRGGWPLTMFLTPDAKPIFGGTYFPPRDKEIDVAEEDLLEDGSKPKQTGLMTVLEAVRAAWTDRHEEVSRSADKIKAALVASLDRRPVLVERTIDATFPESAQAELSRQFDAQHGGFGYSPKNSARPKFPEPSNLLFLLERARQGNEEARTMLLTTLEKMAAGGIRDHLGGGFHRYSTDRFWRVPHFEKMLYDNGQLVTVYAEAYALEKNEDFRRVAEEALAFVTRELTDAEGGFWAAIDAETESEEGKYYVWERNELETLLKGDDFEAFAEAYGFSDGPNFEGRSVLLLPRPLSKVAAAKKLGVADIVARLSPLKARLLEARGKRARPLIDTKILTSWNGLMIRGFADAGRVFENREYLEIARRAARFVLDRMRGEGGRLYRAYGDGRPRLNGYLDDYAFLVDGLLALHRADGDRAWLTEAAGVMDLQIELFWDDAGGGFYYTSSDHETLLARTKDPADNVLPSGNSVSVGALVELSVALDRADYLDRAQRTVAAFADLFEQSPAAFPRMALSWMALDAARGRSVPKLPAR